MLVVLQGRDASGKDGVVRTVFDACNPQGVRVNSFKKPSEMELAHDFLWRVHAQAPEPGDRQEREPGKPSVRPPAGPQPPHDPMRVAPPAHPSLPAISCSRSSASASPIRSRIQASEKARSCQAL